MRQGFILQDRARCGSPFTDGVRTARAPAETTAVASHLLKHGAPGIPEAMPLIAWLMNPGEMPQSVFLALQRIEEDMERAVAEGRDCIEGFEGIHGEVARLLEASPWTLHPSHGCMLTAEMARIDRPASPLP